MRRSDFGRHRQRDFGRHRQSDFGRDRQSDFGRRRRIGLGRGAPIALAATIVGLGMAGCLSLGPDPWAEGIPDSRLDASMQHLPAEARRTLLPLSEIFYARITSRRFNSRATFEDPSMRQFFPTVAAYSDYYAALVDALDLAHIRFNRPTRVELLDIDADASGSLRLSLRFVGANDLPLRFWRAVLLRTDEWRWDDGRWWVVPGKV